MKNWQKLKNEYNGEMNMALFIICLLPLFAWASPAEERYIRSIPILDSAQSLLGGRVNSVANNFDAFFATERADDELGRSRVRVRVQSRMEERALYYQRNQYRFNLRFPQLEKKFKNMWKDRKKAEKSTESPEEKQKRLDRLAKVDQLNTNFIFAGDTSFNASINPAITVRGRIRKTNTTGTLIHRFVQEATWISTVDGFRQTTTLDTDQTITKDLLFRFNNRVDWRISRKDFLTSHGPALFQRLSDDEAITYGLGAGTTVDSGRWFLSGYTAAVTYRVNVYKNMVYWDFQPGVNFPKQWHFRRTPFVWTQLEFLFGS